MALYFDELYAREVWPNRADTLMWFPAPRKGSK